MNKGLTKEQRLSALFKEADIIQNIIKRKSANSFLIKGWTVTLIVATLIFQGQRLHILVAFIPLIAFWFLDAYYRQKVKMYKSLYKWDVDHRLDSDDNLLDLDINSRFGKEVPSKLEIMFSDKLLWFYGSLFILTALYFMNINK